MFESAELGHTVDKDTWKAEVPALREALLDAQMKIGEVKRFSVLLIIGGVEGAGKGETVNLLNEWMDPRHILTHGFGLPTDEERERPPAWRFWRALPPKGEIGIFFGSWYTEPILGRVLRGEGRSKLDRAIGRIRHLERMLHNEDVLVLKLWFHLSKEQQRHRLETLEANKRTAWRVSKKDWEFLELYDDFRAVSERVIRETNTAEAPWVVIEGADARYRGLTAGKVLLEAMQKRLAQTGDGTITAAPMIEVLDNEKLLRDVDLTKTVSKKDYERRLEKLQGELNQLARGPFRDRSLVLVFEGWDAAGKGGAIRRVTAALDARHYHIVPIAKPTDEEYAQPYLWRFWRHLPRHGVTTIFDRSWYGRVLVERVEGYCAQSAWMRSYDEINEFEEQLHESGAVLCKFWLHISQQEQLRRFDERQATSFKRHKITEEDYRNRDKWGAYESAVCDMIDRTSSEFAPWTIVEAEDKRFARLKVLETIVHRLKAAE